MSFLKNLFRPNVSKLANKGDVNALLKLVEDDNADFQTRSKAATALGLLGDKAAVEPLARIVSSAVNNPVKREIVEALGNLGDARAVPAFANYMFGIVREASPLHSTDVMYACIKIGPSAVGPLIELLRKAQYRSVKSRASIKVALSTLAGVKGDGWKYEQWKEWWENNKNRFPGP